MEYKLLLGPVPVVGWRMQLRCKAPDKVTYVAERFVPQEPLGARGLPEFHSMRAEIGEMANVTVPEWVPVEWVS